MPERLEVCGLHIPHGAVCGVWDPLFFANLCLGGVGGGGSSNTAVLEAPVLGGPPCEEEKQGLLCLQECEIPPGPQPAPYFNHCLCPPQEGFFPPGQHISPLKTHIPPSSSLPLGKASPRHRVQSGILPRESGGKQLYGDHVVWPSRL